MAEGFPPGQKNIPNSSTTGGTGNPEFSEDPTMERDIPPPERQSEHRDNYQRKPRPKHASPRMPYGASADHSAVLNPSNTLDKLSFNRYDTGGGNHRDTEHIVRNFALQEVTILRNIPKNVTEVEKDSTSPENQLAHPTPKDSVSSPGKPVQVDHEQLDKQLCKKQDGESDMLLNKPGQGAFHSSSHIAMAVSSIPHPNFLHQNENNAICTQLGKKSDDSMDMRETHLVGGKQKASDREEHAKVTSCPEQMTSRYSQQQIEQNDRLCWQQQTNRKTMPMPPAHKVYPDIALKISRQTSEVTNLERSKQSAEKNSLERSELASEVSPQDRSELVGEVRTQDRSELAGEASSQDRSELAGEVSPQDRSELASDVSSKDRSESAGEVSIQDRSESAGEVSRQDRSDLADEANPQNRSDLAGEVIPKDRSELAGEVSSQDRSELAGEASPQDRSELAGEASTQDRSELAGEASTQDRSELAGEASTQDRSELAGEASTQDRSALAGEVSPHDRSALAGEVSPHDRSALAGEVSPHDRLALTGEVSTHDRLALAGEVSTHDRLALAGEVSPHDRLALAGEVSPHDRSELAGEVIPQDRSELAGEVSPQDRSELAGEASTQDRSRQIGGDAENIWSQNDTSDAMNFTIKSSGGSRSVTFHERLLSETDFSADEISSVLQEQPILAPPPTPSDTSPAPQTPTASHPTSLSEQLQEASPQSETDHHPKSASQDFPHPPLDTPSSELTLETVSQSSVSHQISLCEQLQETSQQTVQCTRLTSQPRVSGDRCHPFLHLHPQEQQKLIASPAENAVIPQKPSQPDTEQNNSTHDTTESPSEFQPSPNTVSDANHNSLESASSHFPCPSLDTPPSDPSCQEQDCRSEPSETVEGMPESLHSNQLAIEPLTQKVTERCSSQPSCDTTLGSTAQSLTHPGTRLPSQDGRQGEGLQTVEVLGQTPPQPPLVDQQAPPFEQLQGGSLQSETDHNSLDSVSLGSQPLSATPLLEPLLQSASQSSNQSTARAPSLWGRKEEDLQTHQPHQTSVQPATVSNQISPSQQVEEVIPQTIQGTDLTPQVSISGDRPACLPLLHTSPQQQPVPIPSPAVEEVTPQTPQQQGILHDTAEAVSEHPPSNTVSEADHNSLKSASSDFPQPSSHILQSGPTQDSVQCSSPQTCERVPLQHERNGEGAQMVLESQPPSVDHQISPSQQVEEASPQGTNPTPQPSVSGQRPACQSFSHPDPHQSQPAELARHNLLQSVPQDVSHHHPVHPTGPVNRPIILAEHSDLLPVPPCSFNGGQLRIRRPAQPRNQPERVAALLRGEASAGSAQLQERGRLGRAEQQPSDGGIRFRHRQTHQGFQGFLSNRRNRVTNTSFVVNLRLRAVDMGETRDLPPDTEADINLHQHSPPIQILGASDLFFRFSGGHHILTMLDQDSERIALRIHDSDLLHELAFFLRDGQHVPEVCVVCRTRAVDVFVLPCCHCVLCRLCLLVGRPPICPLPACRRQINFWFLTRN